MILYQLSSLFINLDTQQFIILQDLGLLANIDTIQKFSDILISGDSFLVDQRASLRNLFNIVTFQPEFIFLLGGSFDGNTFEHINLSKFLFAQEIFDVDGFASVLDDHVDGEMRVNGSHFVSETGGDTDSHVSDVGGGGFEGRGTSFGGPPFGNLDRLIAGFFEFNFQVRKVFL